MKKYLIILLFCMIAVSTFGQNNDAKNFQHGLYYLKETCINKDCGFTSKKRYNCFTIEFLEGGYFIWIERDSGKKPLIGKFSITSNSGKKIITLDGKFSFEIKGHGLNTYLIDFKGYLIKDGEFLLQK